MCFPVLLAILQIFHCVVRAAAAAAECAPYPIASKLGNVTLGNTTARGIALAVGSSKQPFAFILQWYALPEMRFSSSYIRVEPVG